MLEKLVSIQQAGIHYARQPKPGNSSLKSGPNTDETGLSIMDKVSLHNDPVSSPTLDPTRPQLAEDTKYGIFKKLVTDLLKDQGAEIVIRDRDADIDFETLTPEEAEDLVDDDGYFGIEQTSERIFKLAIGIAGGDPTRIDAIKEGIERGFQDALDAFGGSLPDISYDTRDAVMEKLDQWVTESAEQDVEN